MISKEDMVEFQEDWIHVGMVSTYLMMVEKKTMGEVCELLEKYDKPFSFFLPPVDVVNKYYGEMELLDMIDHFIEQEDYEKCAKLKKILDKILNELYEESKKVLNELYEKKL